MQLNRFFKCPGLSWDREIPLLGPADFVIDIPPCDESGFGRTGTEAPENSKSRLSNGVRRGIVANRCPRHAKGATRL